MYELSYFVHTQDILQANIRVRIYERVSEGRVQHVAPPWTTIFAVRDHSKTYTPRSGVNRN